MSRATRSKGAGRGEGWADSSLVRWAILLAFPLVVRAVVFAELSGSPFFDTLFIDARTYHEMAARLSTGAPLAPGPHWQPPLYPYALSWLYRLTGPEVAAARIAQIVLGSVSCALLFVLADRVATRRVAWIAWAAMSLYGPFLFFDLQLLNVTLGTFLLLAFLVATLPLLDAESGGSTPRENVGRASLFGIRGRAWMFYALGAGLLAGSGAITIGNMMLLAPVAAGWVWLRFRSRRAILTGLILLLGAAIPIGGVTIWNFSVSGEPVIVSYNGGVNFWIGNNPAYERTTAIRPGRAWIALTAEPREAGHLGYRAQSDYFFDKALTWMKSDPGAALELLLHKTRLFFRSDEILRNQQIYPFREDSVVLRILLWIHGIGFPFGVVLPFAAVGVAALTMSRFRHSRSGSESREKHANHSRSGSRRARGRMGVRPCSTSRQLAAIAWNHGLGFLLLVAVVYAASVIAFFVTGRYRAPVVPILLVFAGVGAEALLRGASFSRGQLLTLVAAFLVTGLVANAGLPSMPMEFNSDAHSDLGYTHQGNGDPAAARRQYERALELDPSNFEARNNLAGLLSEAGEWTPAVLHLREILEAYPDDQKVLANLGRIYLSLGRPYDAGATFDRMARLDPEDPVAIAGLEASHEMADRVEADEMAANPQRFLEAVRKAAADSPQDRFLQSRLQGLTSSQPE